MVDRPTCKDCRFWEALNPAPADETPNGLCRRSAPQHAFYWPQTGVEDWCGEHEPHGSEADIKERLIHNLGKVS